MIEDEVVVSRAALRAGMVRAGVPVERVERLLRDATVDAPAAVPAPTPPVASGSRFAVLLNYLGGLLVVGAMSVFLGESWSAAGDTAGFLILVLYACGFAGLAVVFHRRGLRLPSGLMATAAVALVPAIVFAFGRATGIGEGTEFADYDDFYAWVSSQWFVMEAATIAIGIIVLRLTDFSLVLAVVGTSIYFAAMDFAEVLFGNNPSDTERALVALAIGVVAIAIGIAFDHVHKRDHAFWPHFFGVFSVLWGYEFAVASAGEFGQWAASELLGVLFLLFGTIAARATYIAVGGILVFCATSWVAIDKFGGSLLTPLVIAAIGLALVVLGVRVQRNAERYQRMVRDLAPRWLVELIPLSDEDQHRFLRHG